jgi:hypothetical protein
LAASIWVAVRRSSLWELTVASALTMVASSQEAGRSANGQVTQWAQDWFSELGLHQPLRHHLLTKKAA